MREESNPYENTAVNFIEYYRDIRRVVLNNTASKTERLESLAKIVKYIGGLNKVPNICLRL